MSSTLPPAYSAANHQRYASASTSDSDCDVQQSLSADSSVLGSSFNENQYEPVAGPHLQSSDDPLLPVLLQCLDATVTGSQIFTNEGNDLDLIIDNTVPTTEQEWEAAIRLQLQRIDYFLSTRTNALFDTKPLQDLLKMKQLNASGNRSAVQMMLDKLSLLPGFFSATTVSMTRYGETWDNSALPVHRASNREKLASALNRTVWPDWFSCYSEMPAEFEVYTTLKPSPIVILYLSQGGIEVCKELDMDRYTEEALPEVEQAYNERFNGLRKLDALKRHLNKTRTYKGLNIIEELTSAANCLRAFNEHEAADELEAVIKLRTTKQEETEIEIRQLLECLCTQFYRNHKKFGPPYLLKSVALLDTETGEPATIVQTKPDEWQYITRAKRMVIPFETVVSQAGVGNALLFYERKSSSLPSHAASPYISHTTDLISMT